MRNLLFQALFVAALTVASTVSAQSPTNDRDDDVHWLLELTIKEGKAADLEPLEAEMSPATEQEEGAVAYEWYRNGDTVHLFERFADSEAALTHLGNFNENFADRFMELFEITGWTLYGPVSEELRAAVEPTGAQFYERVGGFAR